MPLRNINSGKAFHMINQFLATSSFLGHLKGIKYLTPVVLSMFKFAVWLKLIMVQFETTAKKPEGG